VALYVQSTGGSVAVPVRYIVKRSIVTENGIQYPAMLFEDEIWSPSVLIYSKSFRLYPRKFYNYRLRSDSLSTTQHEQLLFDYKVLIEELLQMRDEQDDPKLVEFFERRCMHILGKTLASKFLQTDTSAPIRAFLEEDEIIRIISEYGQAHM